MEVLKFGSKVGIIIMDITMVVDAALTALTTTNKDLIEKFEEKQHESK